MPSNSRLVNPLLHPLIFLFQIFQWLTDKLLSPKPPSENARLGHNRPKIAVIGAGITGVTSAAHCIGHGFDVVIFEAGSKDNVGGIWSVSPSPHFSQLRNTKVLQRVNETSGLQIHSLMYRFHPSVQWDRGYPDRQQIVSQVRQLWERYGLKERTRFNTKIEKVYQDEQGRWIVNNPAMGRFGGVIAAVGTCGAPKMPKIPGMDNFKGPIYHSSDLTGYVFSSLSRKLGTNIL